MRLRFRDSCFVLIALLALLPLRPVGQKAGAPPTDDQVERLRTRMIGTWEMNVAKSKDLVGLPLDRKHTVIYGPSTEKLAVTYLSTQVRADGSVATRKSSELQYLDGKEHEFTAANLTIVRRPI